MRIVARLKRGSLFRLLSFMPVRRAPHASCAFDVHTCNACTCVHNQHHTRKHRLLMYIHASVRYLATVRCKKQFDLAARSISPPSAPLSPPPPFTPLIPFGGSLASASIFLRDSNSRLSSSRLRGTKIGLDSRRQRTEGEGPF